VPDDVDFTSLARFRPSILNGDLSDFVKLFFISFFVYILVQPLIKFVVLCFFMCFMFIPHSVFFVLNCYIYCSNKSLTLGSCEQRRA